MRATDIAGQPPPGHDPRFSDKERAAIAAAVAKIMSGAAAQREARHFEDDPATFAALLRAAQDRR
jgi:hypothetical protein